MNSKEKIEKRYDFVLFFDVKDGNPNGDPDSGNFPRIDPETGNGLVTDVCLKRKVRNYVQLKNENRPPYGIFIKEKAILNDTIDSAYEQLNIDLTKPPEDISDGKKRNKAGHGQGKEVNKARDFLCKNYFDIRAFGAVLTTGANAGQVKGPVQMTFARSIDPIVTLEHSITRMAVTTKANAEKQSGDNRTMGRKYTVPYGLYEAYGFISSPIANQTGFNKEDLSLFWEALENMFEHDHSAARGLMCTRKLIIFEHSLKMGNVPAHKLFDLVSVESTKEPPRNFEDYKITIDKENLPTSIKLIVK